MPRNCGPNRLCGMSQGIYNPFFQNGAYWYGSGGVSAATVYDANGEVIGTTSDNIVLENMLVTHFTINRASTPGSLIGNITDGTNNEPIYGGDEITFSNLQL